MAWINEDEQTAHYLLSDTLMKNFRAHKGIRDYLGRLCHNNKNRIIGFFSNPKHNLKFINAKTLGDSFLAEFKQHLKDQKDLILYDENMPLNDILSFRAEQLQAADLGPSQGPRKEYPCQTVVEAISFKLGQFLLYDDAHLGKLHPAYNHSRIKFTF